MQNSITHLIRFAKAKGFCISVNDGEAWPVKRSTNEKEIMEAVNSVDDATMCFYASKDKEAKRQGTAYITNGLANDELVSNYTCETWLDEWNTAYNNAN